MDTNKIWASMKNNKWKIWKYFKAIYWTAMFVISFIFILLIVLTLFV